MQQSSEIAMAGQYQERMAFSLEFWNSQMQIESSMRDIGTVMRDDWLGDPGLDHDLEDVEIGQNGFPLTGFLLCTTICIFSMA